MDDDAAGLDGYSRADVAGLSIHGHGARGGRAQVRGRGADGPGDPRRSRRGWLAAAVAVVLIAVVGGVGYHYYQTVLSPPDYSGPGTGSVVVQITSGDTATAVGVRLKQLGVVASVRAFADAATSSSQGRSLEPGYFRVHKHMQASLALAMLLNPASRVQTSVTIKEGKRLSQIVAKLGQATGDTAGYARAVKDVAALHLPAYAKGNPEGYLFPATYEIQPKAAPLTVLQQMVTRFDQEASSVDLAAGAAQLQLTEGQVITVASLVQAEGRRLQDFPKIARVIYNRLNLGMKLQLDSTVFYALHAYGTSASTQQTQVNSPYNTYLHTGLPPGPIDSPGDAAIRAALHPASGNWLYFLTANLKTGQTVFTNSYSQFLLDEQQAGLVPGG